MKANPKLLALILLVVLTGCTSTAERKECKSADLVEYSPTERELRYCKRLWGGIVGPDGYVGFKSVGYLALLEGPGPVFVNPRFQDNPGDYRCTGIIQMNVTNKS